VNLERECNLWHKAAEQTHIVDQLENSNLVASYPLKSVVQTEEYGEAHEETECGHEVPHVVVVVEVEQDAVAVLDARSGRHFTPIGNAVKEEPHGGDPADKRQKQKEYSSHLQMLVVENFHEDIVHQIKEEISDERKQKKRREILWHLPSAQCYEGKVEQIADQQEQESTLKSGNETRPTRR